VPTYYYLCLSCEHEFEEYQSITDVNYPPCPECGKETRRVIKGGFKIRRTEPWLRSKDRLK